MPESTKTVIFYRAPGSRTFKMQGTATANDSVYTLQSLIANVRADRAGSIAIVDCESAKIGRAMIKTIREFIDGGTGRSLATIHYAEHLDDRLSQVRENSGARLCTRWPAVILFGGRATVAWHALNTRLDEHDRELRRHGRASLASTRLVGSARNWGQNMI